MQCRFGSVMLQAVTVAFAILAMDVGEALESDQAIFALARAGGKLFAGSRSGDDVSIWNDSDAGRKYGKPSCPDGKHGVSVWGCPGCPDYFGLSVRGKTSSCWSD